MTVSAPSRATASAATTATPRKPERSAAAARSACRRAFICRPCLRIHSTIWVIRPAATNRVAVWKISSASPVSSSCTPSSAQPSSRARPTPAPRPRKRARLPLPVSSLACNQAKRIPAIRKASRLSRQTTKNALPMLYSVLAGWWCELAGCRYLFGDDPGLARFRVEIVEELVGARVHRAENHGPGDAGREYQFLLQFDALEFRSARPLVLDLQAKAHIGRHFHRFGVNPAVLHQDLEGRHVVGGGQAASQQQGEQCGMESMFHGVSLVSDVGAQCEDLDRLGIRVAATVGDVLEVRRDLELRRDAVAVIDFS